MEAQFFQFLRALDETQYLSPDRLQIYQRRLLANLLRHARRQTEFYADRLAPVFRDDDSIDWQRWQEIPILTRREIQEKHAALIARDLPAAAGERIASQSSGSTAEPLHYQNTTIQNLASGCANERFFQWHGIEPGGLMAIIWAIDHNPERAAYPHGRRSKGWRPIHPQSEVIDLAISTPVADQVEWLRRGQARYFSTYPSNMREIGRLAAEDGQPFRFEAILTNGEMIDADARHDIQAAFGMAPLDRYGSTEAGFIAATCPYSLKHHVAAELVLIEIINENGSPAEPGTDGRIVATPLYALAMPLIRYDMGDWGALAPLPCGCRRSLPLLERICGRRRNMFRFSDGTTVWPLLPSAEVSAFVPHRQFQVVQTGPDDIEYRYVPADPAQPVDHAGLTAYARARLHPGVRIRPVVVSGIPRAAGGKHEDYVSLVT